MARMINVVAKIQREHRDRIVALERQIEWLRNDREFLTEVLAKQNERLGVLEGKMAEAVIVLDCLKDLDPEVHPHLWPELVSKERSS